MIESIQIRDFRGIQTGQVDSFRKFNLLVGPNNSGKSAVLEALYLASTASRKASLTAQFEQPGKHSETYDVTVTARDFFGDHPMVRIWDKHNHTKRQIGLARLQEGFLRIDTNKLSAPLRTFDLQTEDYFAEGEEQTTVLFSIENERDPENDEKRVPSPPFLASELMGNRVEPFGGKRLTYCWHPDLTYNYIGSAAWVIKGQLATAQQTLLYDVSKTMGHLPMDFFHKMLGTIPGWTQKIARSFGNVLGIDKPFNVQFLPSDQNGRWVQGWIAPEDRPAITIDAYGDGARSVFKVLTPLLALADLVQEDAPGLLIWEEPELFQNPQTLGRLLAEVAMLMKAKPIQTFIATHSLEAVAYFVELVQENHIAEEDMIAIRMSLSNGKLSSSKFDQRDIQDWMEMRLDLRVPSGKVNSPLIYQLLETDNVADRD